MTGKLTAAEIRTLLGLQPSATCGFGDADALAAKYPHAPLREFAWQHAP